MNKKQILFGALLGLPTLAMADVKFSIDPVTIAPGDAGDLARTVTVNVELSEGSKLSTFDLTIDLPAGLTMKGTDYVNYTTDYGWSLTRSLQTPSQYKFVGYQKNNNHLTPGEGGAAKKVTAFTFEVEADAGFDPKTAGKISLHDVTVADTSDPINNPSLKVKDDVSSGITVYGTVNGINKLNGKELYNPLWFEYLDKDGNDATCGDPAGYDIDEVYTGNFNLTPKHTYHLTLHLDNRKKYDEYGVELGGEPDVRSIQGLFHLPKGIKVKSVTRTGRTLIEDEYLGEVYQENGENLQKFSILAASAPLKNVEEYGTAILEFDLEADNYFDVQQANIVISDFVAGVYGKSVRYTMEQEFTFVIDNPNQVAKDQKDEEIGENGDAAKDGGSLWEQYAFQVEAVHAWVKNSSAVTTQETKAQTAINDLAAEVLNQYQAGTLGDWTDPDGLQAKAQAEVNAIATVAATTLATAQGYDAAAQAAIDAEEPAIPGNVRNYSKIVPIKNVDNEGNGTLKDAKTALTNALADAKANGTLGDNLNQLAGTSLQVFIDAVTGTDPKGQIELLKDAIAEANQKATDNNNAANEAKTTYALASNAAEDDGAIGTSKDGTWYTAQGDLDQAVADAAIAGTQADPDIYKTEIEALEDAKETVERIATDNNDAAAQAIVDYKLLPNIAQDDTQGTWAAAKKALEDEVAAAEAAGTQAKTDIYKEKIDALADALEIVKNKALDNNQKITDTQGEQEYQDALANAAPGANPTIAANEELKAAITEFNEADDAMYGKQMTAAMEGTQAKDDIYKKEIEDVLAAAKALNDKVAELLATAAANEAAVNEVLANDKPVLPAGTGKNDAYANISGSDELIAVYTDYNDAVTDLEDALQSAKDNGLLADNKYKDGDGNIVSLDDAKQAVKDALKALQDELDAQTEQAAKNFDDVEAVKATEADFTAVPAEDLADVNASKTVADAKAEFDAAKQAVEDYYLGMLDDAVAGDKDETAELGELIKTFEEKTEAYQKAIEDATEVMQDLHDMTADLDDLKEQLIDADAANETVSELEKAKIADPSKVKQEDGKLPTTQAQYDALVGTIEGYVDDIQEAVNNAKQAFIDGSITKEQLDGFMDGTLADGDEYFTKTLDELKEETFNQTVLDLTNYLMEVQRGDVNGDGRWTSADYARIRRMILDEDYPDVTVTKNALGVVTGISSNADPIDTEAIYAFASYDINHDGNVNVGDAQATLNYGYYGRMEGPINEARAAQNGAEALAATMNGNRIAISLKNSRQYSAFQLDVVLPEGMSVAEESLAARNSGFSIASSELANGAHRILVTATEAGKAFEGSEGDVLYIDVLGQGTVQFQNILFSTTNCAVSEFTLDALNGGVVTGIASTQAVSEGEQVYSLGGRMMNALKKGINIIRRADGKTEKVIKK